MYTEYCLLRIPFRVIHHLPIQRHVFAHTICFFFANTQNWLEKRYGKGSEVAVFEHYDESNPHVHFVVVLIVEKSVKWKNRRGERGANGKEAKRPRPYGRA